MKSVTDTAVSPVDMQSRRDISLSPGDTVRVHQKLAEKGKVRIQVFEGFVIACKHGSEAGATFTVRRVGSDGIAVEKIFPLYSPMIDRIEVTKRAKVRRSRLYFLRGKTPKQFREKLRRAEAVSESTVSETQRADEPVAETTTDAGTSESVTETAEVVREPGTPESVTEAAESGTTDSADETAVDSDMPENSAEVSATSETPESTAGASEDKVSGS